MEKLLKQNELDMIATVLRNADGISKLHKKFVSNWAEPKNDVLKQLFSQSLIIEKEVEYIEDIGILKTNASRFIRYIVDNSPLGYSANNFLTIDEVIEGIIDRERYFTSTVKVPSGAKLSKIIKHLVNPAEFDKAMTYYSQLFNNKKTKGTLCISIHPLDYITMSVNNSDWESCLNVFRGGYKAGVLSTMNSSCSVIAYLKSKDDFEVCDGVMWNNKKWRSIVSITDEFVHVNRQYPYTNRALEDEVFLMIADALGKKYVSEKKEKNDFDIYTATNFLYNDCDYNNTFVRTFVEKVKNRELRVDGELFCPECGRTYGGYGHLRCRECKTRASRFKIGQKVRMKTEEEFKDRYGMHWRDSEIEGGWCNEMDYLLGKEFVITGINSDGYITGLESQFVEKQNWVISADMIIHVLPKFSEIVNDYFKGDSQYVINCRTEEAAKDFFNYLDIKGILWRNGEPCNEETTKYEEHREEICYQLNDSLTYGNTVYFMRESSKTIIEWEIIK